MEAREIMEKMLMQKRERGKGLEAREGEREQGVMVDINLRREGKGWRPERAWGKC